MAWILKTRPICIILAIYLFVRKVPLFAQAEALDAIVIQEGRSIAECSILERASFGVRMEGFGVRMEGFGGSWLVNVSASLRLGLVITRLLYGQKRPNVW